MAQCSSQGRMTPMVYEGSPDPFAIITTTAIYVRIMIAEVIIVLALEDATSDEPFTQDPTAH
jgi:hypothetical protein